MNIKIARSVIAVTAAIGIDCSSALAASVNGTASATVIAPIEIGEVTELAFGKFTAAAGAVTMSPSGIRTAVNGAATLSSSAPGSAGELIVSGAAAAIYAISSSGGTLTGPNGRTIPLSDITIAASTADNALISTGLLSGDGTQSLKTGGKLTVTADQPVGVYAGNYTVTIEYN